MSDVEKALDKLFHYLGYTSWNVKPDKQEEIWIALKTIRAALQPKDVDGNTSDDDLAYEIEQKYGDRPIIIKKHIIKED